MSDRPSYPVRDTPEAIEQWARSRRFAHDVKEESKEARALFRNSGHHPELDHIPPIEFVSFLVEEVGKLARSTNKMLIADDPDVYREWLGYGRTRLVTSASLIQRMAEVWEDYEHPEA